MEAHQCGTLSELHSVVPFRSSERATLSTWMKQVSFTRHMTICTRTALRDIRRELLVPFRLLVRQWFIVAHNQFVK